MNEPISVLAWAAAAVSVGAASALDQYSVLLLGVPVPLVVAALAGALFTNAVTHSTGKLSAAFRVVLGTLLGSYAAPAVIVWAQAAIGAAVMPPVTHKIIAAMCGATVLLFFEGLIAAAKRLPGDLYEKALGLVGRKPGG